MKQKRLMMITLLISIALITTSFLTLSAAAVTFGQTTTGNYSAWQSGGVMIGSRFVASSGIPATISVYITQLGSSSNTAKCAIYSESNKQLVAVTEEKIIAAGFNGWLNFNFASSPTLTSGSSYSLVVWFKTSQGILRYTPGNAAQSWYISQSYTGNFPNGPYNNLSGYGQESNVYSIYCTVNTNQESSSTPSYSSAPTTSPSAAVSSTAETASSTFGSTAKSNNGAWQPSNTMVASRFTATNTGYLNSISVYLSNGASSSNNVKCAVYSETTRTIVASSQELSINAKASGWFTFATTSASIVAGQRYSLVVWLKNDNCYLSYVSGTSSQSWYSRQTYGSFPSTYSSNGQENTAYSLYATITTTQTSLTVINPTVTSGNIPTPTTIPSLTSTPKPISSSFSKNLAPIFGEWGGYNLYGNVYYDTKNTPQITHADFSVTHNGNPSIRIDGPPTQYNPYREVNHEWIAVRPGDHVVFKCWIKANPSSIGQGGIIGLDAYGAQSRILEITPRNPQSSIWNIVNSVPTEGGSVIYVPYGSGWTQLTIDVTIPSTTYTHDDYGKSISPQQIVGLIPFLGTSWRQGESASCWFADAELYINS